MVDRPFDRKERLAQSVVDPVVGGPPQTQPLSGDIAFGQRGLAAMIEANVPVDVQGAGQFRRGLQPVPGQEPGPFFRPSSRLKAASLRRRQRTSGTRSSPNSLPNSPGGWYCNCSTALMRHSALWANRTITCSVL